MKLHRYLAWLLILSNTAGATLNVCPKMPVATATANNWVSAITAAGATTLAQPAFSNLSGNISTSQMNSGTSASSSTFWRGDGTWVTPTATIVTAPPTIQAFTSSSGTYNKNYTFVITSGSATVGATYTNNGVTFTVWATVASATQVVMNGNGAPASSGTLTKATGTGDATLTFSQVLAPLYLHVRLIGGGGGGGGGNNGGTGGTGGNTTFGSSFLTGNGGVGGPGSSTASTGGIGGTATIASGAYGIAIQGGAGSGQGNVDTNHYAAGGPGAASPFGGGGAGGSTGGGFAAITNSGAGGGGGGNGSNGGAGGGGGGAGGFVDAIVPSPSATYAYAVGAAGTAGSGITGGVGGSGYVQVTEFYQ